MILSRLILNYVKGKEIKELKLDKTINNAKLKQNEIKVNNIINEIKKQNSIELMYDENLKVDDLYVTRNKEIRHKISQILVKQQQGIADNNNLYNKQNTKGKTKNIGNV